MYMFMNGQDRKLWSSHEVLKMLAETLRILSWLWSSIATLAGFIELSFWWLYTRLRFESVLSVCMYLVASTERGIPSSALSGVLELISEQENVHIIPGVQIFPDLFTGIKITFFFHSFVGELFSPCWFYWYALYVHMYCSNLGQYSRVGNIYLIWYIRIVLASFNMQFL